MKSLLTIFGVIGSATLALSPNCFAMGRPKPVAPYTQKFSNEILTDLLNSLTSITADGVQYPLIQVIGGSTGTAAVGTSDHQLPCRIGAIMSNSEAGLEVYSEEIASDGQPVRLGKFNWNAYTSDPRAGYNYQIVTDFSSIPGDFTLGYAFSWNSGISADNENTLVHFISDSTGLISVSIEKHDDEPNQSSLICSGPWHVRH